MNVQEYIKDVCRTTSEVVYTDRVTPATLHSCIGLSAEAGELLSNLKSSLAYDTPFDVANAREEVGDIFFFLFWMIRENNWVFEDILEENHQKRLKRYPDGFTTELAVKRLDKQ